MLPALRLGTFLVPVDDSLIRDTIFVIQNLYARNGSAATPSSDQIEWTNLENLRECLNDTCVFITIHLYSVDQGDFGLGPVAERLEDICEGLHITSPHLSAIEPPRTDGMVVQDNTHIDLPKGKCLVLVLARTPVDAQDEALPDAGHELGLGEWLLVLARLDRGNDVRVRVAVGELLLELLNDAILEGRVLALRPPLCDLRQAGLAEVLIERLVVTLIRREKEEEVLDAASLERACEVLHRLRA